MESLEGSRGDTTIEIFWASLDAAGMEAGEEDAPVRFTLHVSTFLRGPAGILRHEHSDLSGFASTLRPFLAPDDDEVSHAIFDGLAGRSGPVPLKALALWITQVSAAVRKAAAKARSRRTGFELCADIRVFCRPELLDAANAVNAPLSLSPDGVLCLADVQGTETVTLSAGDEECAICFEALAGERTEVAKRMMGCNHVFHGGCLYRWFETNLNCPLCRQTAVTPSPATHG